jgi:hypothetical protein
VEGELVVCASQIKLFKLLEPMWTLDTNTKLVVVCPFLQYIAGSCCDDADHTPNRKLQNFEIKIRSDLEGLKQNLKMYLHTGGHHHCRVMDPLVDTKEIPADKMRGKDPTKPTEEVYEKVAAGIHAVEVRLKLKRQAAPFGHHAEATPVKKHPRGDKSTSKRRVSICSGRDAGGQYQDIRITASQEVARGREGWRRPARSSYCSSYSRGRGSYGGQRCGHQASSYRPHHLRARGGWCGHHFY